MSDTKFKTGQKKLGRKPGVPNKITQDIKRAIDYAFTQINHDNKWLIDMATNGDPADKKLFVQLLARTIPASLSVQVSHTFDLAAAIVAADARLNSPDNKAIEHKPINAQLVDSLVDCKDKDLQPIDIVEPMAPKLRIEQE